MKKCFVVDHGTYPFDVMVCIGMSHDEVLSRLKKRGYEPDKDEADGIRMDGVGRTCMLKSGATVLQVRTNNHGQIAHEIYHAVEFLFDRIGVKYKMTSSETWAYQIQFLTDEIYKKL